MRQHIEFKIFIDPFLLKSASSNKETALLLLAAMDSVNQFQQYVLIRRTLRLREDDIVKIEALKQCADGMGMSLSSREEELLWPVVIKAGYITCRITYQESANSVQASLTLSRFGGKCMLHLVITRSKNRILFEVSNVVGS